MNRKDRRKIKFTEARFRKMDKPFTGFNPKTYNVFHSYSRGLMQFVAIHQRTQRLDGEPRRWQLEKARRRIDQIAQLTGL